MLTVCFFIVLVSGAFKVLGSPRTIAVGFVLIIVNIDMVKLAIVAFILTISVCFFNKRT